MASKKKTKKTRPASKLLKVKRAKTTAANGKAPIPVQARIETKAKEQVTIAKAKGRPMLSWVGKRPLRAVTAFPAQHIESFAAPDADKIPVVDMAIWKDWPEKYPRGGLLFHGDNKEVLAHLLANGFRGQVQLIYIDPPFDSGADYVRKVELRGPKGTTKLEGESYTLGEQIQYTDIWANDNYLQFMYERLLLLKELLKENGVIVLHCDYNVVHRLRCVLDEVFRHPLSPADLEDVKRELNVRANESRDVVVVCLGKELSVDPWLAEWNRMRKQGDTPNKIEVIELRSDPKYGKFIAHKPAQARVEIRRVKDRGGDKLVVEVKDFISPAITERLQAQTDLLSPKISDWRAMVDSVMVDTAYDGKVFNIALADVPERKQDYVKGRYELSATTAKTTVAVKVTDMLGEEVIVTATV